MKNQTNGTTQSQMLKILANHTAASRVIPIDNNKMGEPNQTITVAIDASKLPESVVVGAKSTATVIVKDDDTFLCIRSKVFLEGPYMRRSRLVILCKRWFYP